MAYWNKAAAHYGRTCWKDNFQQLTHTQTTIPYAKYLEMCEKFRLERIQKEQEERAVLEKIRKRKQEYEIFVDPIAISKISQKRLKAIIDRCHYLYGKQGYDVFELRVCLKNEENAVKAQQRELLEDYAFEPIRKKSFLPKIVKKPMSPLDKIELNNGYYYPREWALLPPLNPRVNLNPAAPRACQFEDEECLFLKNSRGQYSLSDQNEYEWTKGQFQGENDAYNDEQEDSNANEVIFSCYPNSFENGRIKTVYHAHAHDEF